MTISEFVSIYRRLYRRLFLYAHDFITDENVCADIVADVFLTLWDKRDSIRTDTVDAYLISCVRNQCLMIFREQRSNDRYQDFLRLTDVEFESIDSAEDRVELLLEVIDTLPERTQYILKQCYLHDKTYRDVAESLGITPDGVKKHITKAYAAIREFFKNRI